MVTLQTLSLLKRDISSYEWSIIVIVKFILYHVVWLVNATNLKWNNNHPICVDFVDD